MSKAMELSNKAAVVIKIRAVLHWFWHQTPTPERNLPDSEEAREEAERASLS